MEEESSMTFVEHLEILRWHIIRSVIAIGIFTALAFIFPEIVFSKIILGPSKADFITFRLFCDLSAWMGNDVLCLTEMPFIIQSRKLTGQFTMHILSSFVVGFVVSFPYVFWEIWRFVAPGLYSKERNASRLAVFVVAFLFFTGVAFGYFIISPLAVNFLGNYQIDPNILNEFDITSYVGTVSMIVLAAGIMFQLPVVIHFLSKMGVVTPASMRTYRKHAFIVILFLSAIITPPDVVTQIFISLPIMFLYEVGIVIAVRNQKKNMEYYEG
jgi:sec-independent protein translocase protein TatC